MTTLVNLLGDLALDTTVQNVRDRIPPALDGDGGMKVHVQNPSAAGLTQGQLEIELDEKFSDLGQKTSANSTSVVLASDQVVSVSESSDIETSRVRIMGKITASGNTTIRTPAAGKAIRLHWSHTISDPTSASSNDIKIFLGSTQVYQTYALSNRWQITGAINDALIINCSAAVSVNYTFVLEEV